MAGGRTVALIPARAGSKGVPGKNFRLMAGKPMISWTIDAAKSSGVFDEIVVSSDSPLAEMLAERHEVTYSHRPERLADDNATLADVAIEFVESHQDIGTLVLLQPTSPTRTGSTIAKAVSHFLHVEASSLMSVTGERHLYWKSDDGQEPIPLYSERVNRQQLKIEILRESGAIQIVDAAYLKEARATVSPNHELYKLPDRESVDIDNYDDFAAAERILGSGQIIFRLTANTTVGSGHLYHCMQLAEGLKSHGIQFLLKDCDVFAEEMLRNAGYEVHLESDDIAQDLQKLVDADVRTVVVNDVLDTDTTSLAVQHQLGCKVVTVEDLGAGLQWADLVINALYGEPPGLNQPGKVLSGAKWAPLRPEFSCIPKRNFSSNTRKVLLTFGGTDPCDLTARTAKLLRNIPDVEVTVVLGPGYQNADGLDGVDIVRTPKSMAALLCKHDVAVTSAGRTVFEAAACGTPVVVIAQNMREATHTHLSRENGVAFLGVAPMTTDSAIEAAITGYLDSSELRDEVSARLRSSVDDMGASRIVQKIEELMKGL